MNHAVILAIALSFGACSTAPIARSTVRADGIAAIGQPTRVGALIVTPQALVEDSRCPINARCVWAGRLVLTARIDGRGWHETVNLTLGEPFATHATGLVLVSAEPGRIAGSQPSPSATLFGFEPH